MEKSLIDFFRLNKTVNEMVMTRYVNQSIDVTIKMLEAISQNTAMTSLTIQNAKFSCQTQQQLEKLKETIGLLGEAPCRLKSLVLEPESTKGQRMTEDECNLKKQLIEYLIIKLPNFD